MSREGEIPEVVSGVVVVERAGELAVAMPKAIIGIEVIMMMVTTKSVRVTTKIAMVTTKTILRNL